MKTYNGKKYKINIVTNDAENSILSVTDKEMDRRAEKAVAIAIEKAEFCNKPVARYNIKTKQAYLDYGNGEIKYVR